MRTNPKTLASLGLALIVIAIGGSGMALAHHPMGGAMPTTLWHGFLSGIGHPVIGPDHFAFIVAIGIAAALLRDRMAIILGFIAASSAGVLMHVAALGLPMAEPLVAVSVIVAGAILATRAVQRPVWVIMATVAGLFHGYAFGEAVVGAERDVIGAYLVGIAVVTMAITWACTMLVERFVSIELGQQVRITTAGMAIGIVGIGMLVTSLA
jgi:urease accessory protein